MRLYHPDHRGVTPYNELGELDYRDPESRTGSGKDQPRDSTWFFVTDETDGDCRDTRICCFCRLYRWAKQQIAVFPASASIMKVPKNLRGKSSFNLQSLVEGLRENGRLVDRNPAYLETVVDWKVLELKPIEKGMELWIEAPLGSFDISGNVFRITGKTDAESQKLLDSVPPAKKRTAPDFEP